MMAATVLVDPSGWFTIAVATICVIKYLRIIDIMLYHLGYLYERPDVRIILITISAGSILMQYGNYSFRIIFLDMYNEKFTDLVWLY